MKFKNKNLIAAGDVSGNLVSDPINMNFEYGLSYIASFTGSPSGAVLLEASNDDQATWTQVKSDTISGTTSIAVNQDAQYWQWLRIRKAAGGTGTMTVWSCVKGA